MTALREGSSVGVTADVPRVGGHAGLGIVTLARMSRRPIVPVAVATSNMIRLATWDRATINLPFSRGAFVVGELVTVPPDADQALLEAKRRDVEKALDAAHERAYELVGRRYERTGGDAASLSRSRPTGWRCVGPDAVRAPSCAARRARGKEDAACAAERRGIGEQAPAEGHAHLAARRERRRDGDDPAARHASGRARLPRAPDLRAP